MVETPVGDGDWAIHSLEAKLTEIDSASSSHWDFYHKEFSSSSGGRELGPLAGFGTVTPRTPWRMFMHWLMLFPFGKGIRSSVEQKANLKSLRLVAQKQDRSLDLDMFRQALTLTFLNTQLHLSTEKLKTWLVIGDGFGVLTALILLRHPGSRVVLINLDRTLLIDLVYLRMVFGDNFDRLTCLVQSPNDLQMIFGDLSMATRVKKSEKRLIAIRAQESNLLRLIPVDIAINVASMQEMNYSDINRYFAIMRGIAESRSLYFYCCNREDKTLPDGTRIRFNDYPWSAKDSIIVDELCPWHQHFYSLRPPRYRAYDGPIQHRLTLLAPTVSCKDPCRPKFSG